MVRCLLLAALVAAPSWAQSIVIDDFEDGIVSMTLSAPGTTNDWVDAAGVLGVERNVRIGGSSVEGGNVTAFIDEGKYVFTRPDGSSAQIDLWWDGDNSTATFDGSGLGGVDLTANGQNAIRVAVESSSSGSQKMGLSVYSGGSNVSRFVFLLPAGGGGVDLPYGGFATTAGSGADFANVGALFLNTYLTTPGWTGTITDIRTVVSTLVFSDGFESGDRSLWSASLP